MKRNAKWCSEKWIRVGSKQHGPWGTCMHVHCYKQESTVGWSGMEDGEANEEWEKKREQ